ncbi:phage tail tape measure protein [Pseudomonas putida]|uniref:phage tail tape measure protein n=1 Tax=Pseudomonas putida TaxID=303 RepID=UPI0023646863|nr:phage tail tape measure protein [Pseudomonas putida]MDD2054169.1 phage tail tape measure protein [Pseudomonas putida]
MASKSLGTLTLDLVARIGAFTGPLDKASQAAKQRNAEMAKSFDSLAKGVGVAIGSIPAILSAMVVSSVGAAKEISNQAALAGLGTTEFQKYAAGARSVGVEQDKLSDILKDTNDKLGDFASTGGGALKDFFDNIAPKVGVTADSFKKLNSKEALSLYVTSLEKANVNQKEMTFYMEAIANDSTALVPLLRNGGKAFDELGQAALDTGVVLDEKTIAAAKQFGIELSGLQQYISSARTMLAAEFLPVLAQFTKDVNSSAKEAGGLKGQVGELGQSILNAAAFVVSAGDGVTRVFKIIANTLVGTFSTAAGYIQKLGSSGSAALSQLSFGDTSKKFKEDAAQMAASAKISFDVAGQAAEEIKHNLEAPLAGDRFKEYVAKAKEAAAEIAETTQTTTLGTGANVDPEAAKKKLAAEKKAASEAVAAAKKIQSAFSSTETDLQRQIELINTSTDARKNATEAAKLQFEFESGKLIGLSEQQKDRLRELAAELDVRKKLKQANEDAAKLASFGASLDESNNTAKDGFDLALAGAGSGDKYKERLKEFLAIRQDFNSQMSELQKQLNSGDISEELYNSETELLKESLDERLEIQQEYYEQLDEAQNDWLDGVSSAWENYRDTALDYQQQAADFTSSMLQDVTANFGDNIAAMALEGQTLGETLENVAVGFGRSMVNALAQVAAQWLITQAIQLVTGKATQASAATAMAANAQATSLQAGLAAFASTAAIPIVGPVAAPGAMAAALAVTTPLAAAVGVTAMTGMAHDGIDSVPQTGTWLLEKGERVTTSQTSAKLDATLANIQRDQAGGTGSARRDGRLISQTINVSGLPDNRTANQIAAASSRKQRQASRLK